MRNIDKLKVRQTESREKAFKELTIIRNTIFWIDVVGEEQNENAIFARPFNDKEAFPQKLTSKKFNIKNNFHGYGGKSYKCINFKNNFYLIWIDQITKAVWFQIFKEAVSSFSSENKYLDSIQEPRQLSKSIDDVIIEPQRLKLIPNFKEIVDAASKYSLGSGISGAGPSIFSICKGKKNAELALDTIRKITDEKKLEYNLILSGINKYGIKIINKCFIISC